MINCVLSPATFANEVTQADFDEWVKDSSVSEAITLHAAELGINRLHLYVNAALKAGVGGEG